MSGFNVTEFAQAKAKPLPIILLLDESGSMAGENIETLNKSVKKMISTFKTKETQASEFLVSIIAFGGSSARIVNEPVTASKIEFSNLSANGMTPLGSALDLAKGIVEDKEKTPSRAYRPLVILVCDGYPNDSWEDKFNDFIENGRSAKCDRMALAIGTEGGIESEAMSMLERFVAGTGHEVFNAEQAEEIFKFFKFVTMSVVSRSMSQNPNRILPDASVAKLEAPQAIDEPVEDSTPEIVSAEEVITSVVVDDDDDEEEPWF